MVTFFILLILIIAIILAIRSLIKSKGCVHDCSNCSQSCSALSQEFQNLLAEAKKK